MQDQKIFSRFNGVIAYFNKGFLAGEKKYC